LRPPPAHTPLPYTTLFRSLQRVPGRVVQGAAEHLPGAALDFAGADHRGDGKVIYGHPATVAGVVPDHLLHQPLDAGPVLERHPVDRKSTRLNSSHLAISYA